MKVAIVHDQLQEFGGAERVLVALKKIFPDADVFTSFYNPESLGIHRHNFEGWNIITSWADKVPFLKNLYSPLRFITPLIWEHMKIEGYDLIISSSGSYMCKGIIPPSNVPHICYLHHPPRYLYGYETAIEWQKYWPIKIYGHLINHGLRQWDFLSSQRVNYFIANSHETKRRVEKFYRRDATVIYPPVDLPEKQSITMDKKLYYLTVSRLARAKHIDVLISAANKYGFQLKVVGSGRDSNYLHSIAGPNIEFLFNIRDNELGKLYKEAKAYLFAAVDEEFGISPVEAMGHNLPVIAYASGGLLETIKDGENGYLYQELNADSLHEKIKLLEELSEKQYERMCRTARTEAEKYSFRNFKTELLKFIETIGRDSNRQSA